VKSCEYLLRDHLRKGGSVDALKRRHLGCQLGDAETDDKSVPEDVILEDSILGIVAAADLVRELSRRLAPSEAKVLSGLAEGCAVAEIAEQLKISPRTVFNYRKTIVATALQIGLAE
jgi:DNA-binding NarL/FixJ family response regulator